MIDFESAEADMGYKNEKFLFGSIGIVVALIAGMAILKFTQ